MTSQILQNRIEKLEASTPARFGIMTAQHMIEHLIITLKLSYGRIQIPEFEPTEKQLSQKQVLLYTDTEVPKGVKAPGLPDTLMELKFPSIESAKSALLKSLEEYHNTFDEKKDLKTTHPRFGKLTFDEWERFHSKHIAHHLEQFGL
jgi:oxepin-CoA hydrolase/3-oxo-5,6-dehydrosuberyl-CoA semialdehyde dehydrogenase